MESSKSRPVCGSNLALFVSGDRESSLPASRPLLTILGERFHKECETSPAGAQMNGEHNVVGWRLCRSQHRAGNKPRSCQFSAHTRREWHE